MTSPSPPIEPRIKVCGLTRLGDVKLAQSLGCWALGFIFASESPRRVTASHVKNLLAQKEADNQGFPLSVGVFVNATVSEISEVITETGLTGIQLHGEESADFCKELRQKWPSLFLMKAFRLSSEEELTQLAPFDSVCSALMLDTFVPGKRGGTGVANNFVLVKKAALQHRILFSGGLSPENVQEALLTVSPYALDVSSSLEESPGVKLESKMRLFFERARSTP